MKYFSLQKRTFAILTVLFLSFVVVKLAAAQEPEQLRLRLSRDFGYASGTGAIQGTFSMRVSGPEDLARVQYFIDETMIGEVGQSPFNLRFSTDNYSLGIHRLMAVGYTRAGIEIKSNDIQAEFVSADQGFRAVGNIIIPLLALVALAMLLSAGATVFSSRKLRHLPLGASRKYGAAGGAICPKCHRPFSRHILSPNLLFGKLERCPFCGKWSIVRAQPVSELKAAEQAEILDGQNGVTPSLSVEEKLRQELERSRYQDL